MIDVVVGRREVGLKGNEIVTQLFNNSATSLLSFHLLGIAGTHSFDVSTDKKS